MLLFEAIPSFADFISRIEVLSLAIELFQEDQEASTGLQMGCDAILYRVDVQMQNAGESGVISKSLFVIVLKLKTDHPGP